MIFKTLIGVSEKDILDVFNWSFSDYFIPLKLTAEQLATKMISDNVDLSLSVGVFENGRLIAFILHGFNQIAGHKTLYNGGTGVLPTKRGQGLTCKMYDFILPTLKKSGINTLVLEVISKNIQAIKSYRRSGYSEVRRLLCYKGVLNPLSVNEELEIKIIDQYDWKKMESFWDFSPTAQNSKSAINKLRSTVLLIGAFLQNQMVGYMIYNPKSQRLQQIAVKKIFRRKLVASTLLQKLNAEFGTSLVVINVDMGNQPINDFFVKAGLACFLEQVEMKREVLSDYD